ncbi:hypothetical protein AURDEDRAFT_147911 [Auricularia subglabra TFB-10046 SS5]|nr:hypothetical protein AURDEDRAFT_147911 [Auricularia subglabra TFB-10046 SS5]
MGELLEALPPELLSHIFEVGASIHDEDDADEWEDTSSSSGDSDSSNESEDTQLPFQLAVSSVCRHWRQVALATPTLWTVMGNIDLAYGAIHLDLLRELLDRSKGAPLYITLDVDAVRLSEDEDVVPEELPIEQALRLSIECFKLVMSHAWHWYDFEVEFQDESLDYLDHFLPLLYAAPEAPLLKRLGIFVDDPSYHDDEPQPRSLVAPTAPLFGSVRPPRLIKITLWGTPLSWNPFIKDAILSDLACLELGLFFEHCAPTMDEYFSIIRANPSLERLELHYCVPPDELSAWPLAVEDNVIEIPSLRELSLAGFSGSIMRKIVDLVHTPNITDLRILLEPPAQEDYVPFFEHMVAPRVLFPNLDRLHIEGFGPETETLARIFQAHPLINDLTFEFASINDGAIELLRYNPPVNTGPPTTPDGNGNDDATVLKNMPLPKLQTLRVLVAESGMEIPGLLEVLKSRADALCPVNTLLLHAKMIPPEHDELLKVAETVEYFYGSDDEDSDEDGIELVSDLDGDDGENSSGDELDLLSSQFQATGL